MPRSLIASPLVLALLFAFRLFISVYALSTADVPDEWWQSTEVAYHVVHGKGEMTWEWRHGIRSYIYPLPFIIVFWVLRLIGCDSALTYWLAPKLLTTVVAFLIDYHTAALATKMFGPPVGRSALLLSAIHGWTAFIGTRTQSNVAEALVLLVTLQQTVPWKFFLFAAIGCALRTTFALPVIPAAIALAVHSWRSKQLLSFCVVLVLMICTAFGVIAAVDSAFYGRFVISPIQFLLFNVVQGSSALFGTHAFHWYFTAALPTLLDGHLILVPIAAPVIASIWKGRNSAGDPPAALRPGVVRFVQIIGITLIGYSLLKHKEFRFVYPLLPLMIILLAIGWSYSRFAKQHRKILLSVLVLVNATFFIIFGVFFQRGTMDVVTYLRNNGKQGSVHVLTGCHQLPGYSYMHQSIGDLVTMNCSIVVDPTGGPPRFNMENHLFRHYPVAFVDYVYDGILTDDAYARKELQILTEPKSRELPMWIVVFTHNARVLAPFLERHGYKQIKVFYHTTIPVEDDIGTTIEIWRDPNKTSK